MNLAQADSIFGNISPPPGVGLYDTRAGGQIGLMYFISNAIKLATLVAGLWVLLNFVMAGYEFLKSSGDSAAYGKVAKRLTMSVVGLVIIIAAYAIVGVIGLLFFGDAGFILNPTIQGPGFTPASG